MRTDRRTGGQEDRRTGGQAAADPALVIIEIVQTTGITEPLASNTSLQ